MNKLPPLPKTFLWGVASSGYQSEGGNVDSNWDRYNAAAKDQDPYGRAVDFRNRYREDIALARDLGCNAYRFGINWARIERQKGQFDEAELAYYADVIAAIREAGMEPVLTLDHFVYPGWVGDQGAWENPATVDDFLAYVKVIVERHARDVKLWITFNETAFFSVIELKYRKFGFKGLRAMRRHTIRAHNQAYALIKAARPDAMVTSNIVWCGEGWKSRLLQMFTDWLFLNGTHRQMDWIAFDYYYGRVDDLLKGVPMWDCDPVPANLGKALRKLARRFPKQPLFVAENGMPTDNAKPRADGRTREGVLRDCVTEVQQAVADGVNVTGYLYWSLTDNFEWGKYGPRFGLYTVDVMTDPSLVRKPTAAVAAYKDIIRNGGA